MSQKINIIPIVIAGVQSGVGKTTVSTAVMRAFVRRDKKVVPFKVGPDYIDPKFHSFVTGKESHNLDSWMLDENVLRYLYQKNIKEGELPIIEGVMGLFDGYGDTSLGSTAHVAKILGAAVILIVNARGISSSVSALISGYMNYDPQLEIRGVIFNNVSGEKHYELLKSIVGRDLEIDCLGFMPRVENALLESRHLGLVPVEELDNLNYKIGILADSAEKYVDLEKIEKYSFEKNSVDTTGGKAVDIPVQIKNLIHNKPLKGKRIAVASDEAFSFYYNDNLTLLEECGSEIVRFSPIRDMKLPERIDFIYLGGGFPEIFAKELSKNKSLLQEIKSKAESGLPVYAECGGLMYLTNGTFDLESNFFELTGLFNCKSRMTERLQQFGYSEVNYKDIKIRAHEFHHSLLEDVNENDIIYSYQVEQKRRNKKWQCGLTKFNVLASYSHIHFYSNVEFFIKIFCANYKEKSYDS